MTRARFGFVLGIGLAMLCAGPREAAAEVQSKDSTGFTVTQEIALPGSPAEVFDAFTGDVTGWWDHSFSKNPKAMYIEPKPGGGFFEIFDAEGNGALHARVTYVEKGKLLRFTGPLGLAGRPIEMVHTFKFTDREQGGTLLRLDLEAMGRIQDGWAEAVDGVWKHFLFERFRPYLEARTARK